MSLLISRRCRDSNKLVRQREEEGAECPVWDLCVCARVCACVCMHTNTHRHRLTLTYSSCPQCASPRLVWDLILTLSSQSGLEKAVKLLCALFHPPSSVLCLPPKSSEITGSACRDAESNPGLIFGSTCDLASFTLCPVVMSVSTHPHTLIHIHPPIPKAVH